MKDSTKVVFNGWLNLSNSERAELEEEIRRYKYLDSWRQRSLKESVGTEVKSILGPMGGRCECCGR